MKNFFKQNYEYFILFGITLLLFSSLIGEKTIVGADTQFHFANSQSYLTKLVSLNFTPKLLPIIGNNFLYSTPIFYGTLPHLLTALLGVVFYFFKIASPIVLSMKIFYILIFFLSSIVMFKWIKSVSKDRLVALVGSVFYLTLPFKLWDTFVRDGYTEMFTFLFIPMIFYGLHSLLDKQDRTKFYFYFIIGTSGVILSHLITTIFVFIAGIIYIMCEHKKVLKKENIISLLLSFIIIIGITAYYWIPFMEHLIHGGYRIFDGTGLDLKSMLLDSTVTWKQLICINKMAGDKQFFIPITLLLAFVLGIIKHKKIINGRKNHLISIIITILFISIAMCKPLLKILPESFYSIQYIYRLLIVPLCFLCFSASFAFLNIKKQKIKYIFAICCIVFSVAIGYFTIDKVYITDYNLYNGNLSENGMGWQKEYLPTKAINWYLSEDAFENRGNEAIILNGSANIETIKKEFDQYELTVSNVKEEYKIEYPYYYYLGYSAFIENEGIKTKLEVSQSERGLVSISFNKPGKIILSYNGTVLMKSSYIFTAFSIVAYIILIIKTNKKQVNIKSDQLYKQVKNDNIKIN